MKRKRYQNRALRTILSLAAVPSLMMALPVLTPQLLAAQDDCFTLERCEMIRDQVRDGRRDAREHRREIHQLRRELRQLPSDSPEREHLREQIRSVLQQLREVRRETRHERRDLRQHCRGCFGDDSDGDG